MPLYHRTRHDKTHAHTACGIGLSVADRIAAAGLVAHQLLNHELSHASTTVRHMTHHTSILQINPHFTNALPEGHKGETREQRIRELLVVAPELTIIGLPEGNWITVSKGHATLGGPNTTYVFKAGEEAVPLEAGHRF